MIHILIFELKRKLRNRMLLFWIFLFPFILNCMFTFVIKEAYTYTPQTISIGIIEHPNQDQMIEFVKQIQKESRFQIVYVSKQEAYHQLDHEQLSALLEVTDDGKIQVICKAYGVKESMIISAVNMYEKQSIMLKQWLSDGKTLAQVQTLHSDMQSLKNQWSSKDSAIMYVCYFSTITMACMYSGLFSIRTITELQANQSAQGKRLHISFIKKSQLVWIQVISNNIICVILHMIQLYILIHVFGVSFQNNTEYAYVTTAIGSFLGTGIGMCIGCIHTIKTQVKMNIVSFVTLFLCMLSGMCSPSIKYVIHKNIPLLEIINPCALLTDTLLRLSLYGMDTYYMKNMLYLFIFACISYCIVFIVIRRQQYASL